MHYKYSFSEVGSLLEAQSFLETHRPNVILLDWMLPDGSGIQLLNRLRQDPRHQDLPIIMLTARSAEADISKGLDNGADDYITKPFSVAELSSRIRALLRRVSKENESKHLIWEAIRMDLSAFHVYYHDKPIKLHRREFSLLKTFLEQAGKVLSREQLLDKAWGEEAEIGDRAVDVSIRRLRKAFEEHNYKLPLITIRGMGYRLDKPA
ncbi:winged helix-turn-helix domain-containing protein [Suttonella ornithocola]|uniref:Phosphate regulon transcriptional regulatory protein phoB n=1 Tax=Suttonella ornithocola TaxID=279832 RepID=A0A380MX61_9GAMM|nr:winged helix-turn-helix domain-containing protein [Suttonella ornithocola]SUO97165.1 Phosphate regulon transcriptional regulatory protein phoB [Suttonella ornithocola]